MPRSVRLVVIVDRDTARPQDRVLVAHLFAEEPAANADLLCALYVADCRAREVRCARYTGEQPVSGPDHGGHAGAGEELLRASGCAYRLELSRARMTIPELRRVRSPACGGRDAVSVRDVVAATESYEPVLTVTMRALALRRDDGGVSTTVLRAELARVLRARSS